MKKLILTLITTTALSGMVATAQADIGVYKKSCQACHAFGPGPKVGNKADWEARIAKGMPALIKAGIEGTAKGMPPKGGNMKLTDAQVESAVKYMVGASK